MSWWVEGLPWLRKPVDGAFHDQTEIMSFDLLDHRAQRLLHSGLRLSNRYDTKPCSLPQILVVHLRDAHIQLAEPVLDATQDSSFIFERLRVRNVKFKR